MAHFYPGSRPDSNSATILVDSADAGLLIEKLGEADVKFEIGPQLEDADGNQVALIDVHHEQNLQLAQEIVRAFVATVVKRDCMND